MLNCLSIICTVWLAFTNNNAAQNDSVPPEIDVIEFRESTTWFGERSNRVYYTGPFVIYQSHYTYTTSSAYISSEHSSNQTIFDSVRTWSQERSRFFVFHKDSSYGVIFDPLDSIMDNRRLEVDSARLSIQGRNSFESLLCRTPDSVSWNARKTELREVYVCKGNKDTPTIRLVMHYSSLMNNLKESINQTLDSAKNMKLYKTEYLFEEFFDERIKQCVAPMKFISEMKAVPVENPEEVIRYINKYRKSVGLAN